MILSFKTKINNKPTFFVEKIHKALRDYKFNLYGLDPSIHYPKDYNFFVKDKCLPKLHTIRKDDTNRWEEGKQIDFFINARQKNMFRFAPRLPVISIQYFGIFYHNGKPEVNIDGRYLFDSEIEKLALNDGFENTEDFLKYFSEDFNGKIMHWTDLHY